MVASNDIDAIILKEVENMRAASPYKDRMFEDGIHNLNYLFLPDRLLRNYLNPDDAIGNRMRSLPLDINRLSRNDIKQLSYEQVKGSLSEAEVLDGYYPGIIERLREEQVDETGQEIFKRHLISGLVKKGLLTDDDVEHLGYKYNGLENPTLNDILAIEKKIQLYHHSLDLKYHKMGFPTQKPFLILRDTCPYIRKFKDDSEGSESVLVEESKSFPIVNPESLRTVNPHDRDYDFDSVVDIVWAMTKYAKSQGLISTQLLDGTIASNIVCFKDFSIDFDSLVNSLVTDFKNKESNYEDLKSSNLSNSGIALELDFGIASHNHERVPTSEYLLRHSELVEEIFNTFMARKMANVSAKNDLAKNMWRFSNLLYQTNFQQGDIVSLGDSVKEEVIKQYALGNWIGYSQNGWIQKKDCDLSDDACVLCKEAKKSMRAGELTIVPEVVPGYVDPSGLSEFKGGITRKLTPEEAFCSEELDFQKSDLKAEMHQTDIHKMTKLFSDARFGLEYLELHRRYNLVNVDFELDDNAHLTKFKVDFYS